MMSLTTFALSRFNVAGKVILPRWLLIQTVLRTAATMFHQAQAQLSARAELLLTGQLAQLVQHYRYPLPMLLGEQRVIVRTQGEALSILALLRQALMMRRVVALQPNVTAVDIPRGGRFRLWVDWQELAIPVDGTRMSSAIYYCRQIDGGVQTEMVQYTRLSMPELNPKFAALALSA
jgi:hypothetical protein